MGKAGKKLVEKTKVEKYLKQAKCASAFPGKLYRLRDFNTHNIQIRFSFFTNKRCTIVIPRYNKSYII